MGRIIFGRCLNYRICRILPSRIYATLAYWMLHILVVLGQFWKRVSNF